MAALTLPQEVTDHLEAAILLANRRVHLRYLEEAETLIGFNDPVAAILVAGVVLESILGGFREKGSGQERHQMENWLDVRNRVAPSSVSSVSNVTLDQARDMVKDVRTALTQDIQPSAYPSGARAEALGLLRGKYKFVATSSSEFIRRKADELMLEDDEHSL